jgi:hypothetical protein
MTDKSNFSYLTIFIFSLFMSCCSEVPTWKNRGFPSENAFNQFVTDSLNYQNLSTVERCKLIDPNFKEFITVIKTKPQFLAFDGQWFDCNHSQHNYIEFNFNANKLVKISFTLTDSVLSYKLSYLEKDIREVWGTETEIKKIISSGIVDCIPNKPQCEYFLKSNDLNDLIVLKFNLNDNNKPKIEVTFDCKTCLGNEILLLYPAQEIKNRMTGYRAHLWNGSY